MQNSDTLNKPQPEKHVKPTWPYELVKQPGKTPVEAALFYISHNFPVFPCCWPTYNHECGCGHIPRHEGRDIGKAPITAHGFKDATLTIQGVREYWRKWPRANVGIAIPAGLIVLDVDVLHNGFESLAKLQNDIDLTLPDTLRITTGSGGAHISFKTTVAIRNTVELAGYEGLDIRGHGGYVIAPPSIHACGGNYYVAENLPIAEAPAQLIQLCLKRQPHVTEKTGILPDGEPIKEGTRDATLASFAGTMRKRGMTPDEIELSLRAINRRCLPPLDDSQVHKIAYSIGRYEPGHLPQRRVREVF